MELERLTRLISMAKGGYERYEPVFTKLSMAYLAQMEPSLMESLRKRGKSHLYIPAVNSRLKKLHTSFMSAYFTNDTFATLMPNDTTDRLTAKAAKAVEDALAYYQRQKRTNLYKVLDVEFLNIATFGTCFVKVTWGNGSPVVEGIKIRDLWLDPNASKSEDLKFLVHRIYVTSDDIEELQRLDSFKKRFDSVHSVYSVDFSQAGSADPYERIELYDVYYIDKGEWYLSTLLGQEIVRSRYKLEDGLPIFIGTLMPQLIRPDETDCVELYGDSIVASILPLQNELNIRRNQQIDAIALQMNPKMIVQQGAGIAPHDLRKGAGAMISAINPAGVRELAAPNITSASNDVHQLDLEMQEAIGVTSYNSGIDSKRLNDTATGISIISQEANQRIEQMIRSINETLIEPLFRHMARLVWKYGESRFFEDVKEISRDTELDYFIQVNTGLGATNKQIQLNGLHQAFQMLLLADAPPAAKRVLRDMLPILGIKNTQEYISDADLAGETSLDDMGDNQSAVAEE